jgi:hypothetical protein
VGEGSDGPMDEETVAEIVACTLEDLLPTAMRYLVDLFDREYFVRS